LRGGQFNQFFANNIKDDGTIDLTKTGDAWSTLVCNPENLVGVQYELKVYKEDGTGKQVLVGDKNKDGKLSATERKTSVYNDPWDNVITRASGDTFRMSVVADNKSYTFKHDDVPREKDPKKWVIYQMHPGSIFGDGGGNNRSNFKDIQERLTYFKSLGVNTLEMMPANEVEGSRDWGYMGANSLAIESSYGFEENGRFVTGAEALKRFIDEAHRQGFNVINDVVYNHIGGNHNFLWNMDGKENPYFNWSQEAGKFEKRDTDWGAMPAYNKQQVKQLFVDHAVSQVTDFHFDGLRFDFTEPMKREGQGGKDGWEMMREINRQLHYFKPGVFTAAEQFDYDPTMTRPAEANGKGGGGFDAQWYTEYQHRLVHDNSNPSIIEQAVKGHTTNMDQFMGMLTNPRGLTSWSNAVTVISNHDEVGNADRTINVANNYKDGMPPQYSRNLARFTAGIGLASPGIPMFFNGDESLAQNKFKWGNPTTWDIGWKWETTGQSWDWNKLTFNDNQKATYDRLFSVLPADRQQDPAYQALSAADKQVFNDLAALPPKAREETMLNITRRQTFRFYQDAIKLRESSPAFDADASVNRVYTHNENSVMAFTRKKGNEEFLVVASLNRNNLQGYGMELPPGQWKEVLSSDAAAYGGNNFGNFGATLNGGNSAVNIPAGGYVMFKRVG
jgi:1,4-alpha-glucan branching enzyme